MVAELGNSPQRLHDSYENMVRFASEGELAPELHVAKAEFVTRTGELFETEASFDRRIAAFLEWYVLDRAVRASPSMTPAKLYIDSMAPRLTTPELTILRGLTRTHLSLFEFRRVKGVHLRVVDLLTGKKHDVFERRRTLGLEPGDIIEARIIPYDEGVVFGEAYGVHPREAQKAIRKGAKAFRQGGNEAKRIDFVHRVAFLANRCERYKHVDPKKIFAELVG